ncbi:MAG: hypothetical protein HYS81_02685 [Candidatus Aenigmatarchaeota archaeon]|nr:MAG: hypothetical protein HYS81_02685 [Candidatus Aenigmarchaeota archaeon]
MLSKKGFNQVDLAVGLSLMLAVMTFAIIYTNTAIAPQVSSVQSFELRATAKALGDMIFEDRGVPTDWPYQEPVRPSLMEYIYAVPLSVRETNGTGLSNGVISVNLTTGERAYNGSIKVYDGNTSLATNVVASGDTDSDGLLEWANISFRFSIGPREKKLLNVYYSADNTTAAAYTSLTQTANTTFNVTIFGEQSLKGLTPLKLGRINNKTSAYLRPLFGIKRDFRIEIANVTGTAYAAGDDLPKTTNVVVNERLIPSQNRTAHINLVKATLWIW